MSRTGQELRKGERDVSLIWQIYYLLKKGIKSGYRVEPSVITERPEYIDVEDRKSPLLLTL
jgi:hypothetical protein